MSIRMFGLVGAGVFALNGAAAAAIDDKKAAEILTKAGCATCHTVDKTLVGPTYVDVSKNRKTEKGAAATLAKKVRDGGTGVYGPIPMPPNPADKISDADLKAIVEWVLTK